MSGDFITINEAASRTGRAPRTVRADRSDFPEIAGPGTSINWPAYERFLDGKTGRDIRTINKTRAVAGSSAARKDATGNAGSSQVSKGSPAQGGPVASTHEDDGSTLAALRLEKERALVERAKIANAKAAKDLVRLSDAKTIMAGIVVATKQRFESIPAKVAADLVGRSKEEIEAIIKIEIEAGLREIARGQKALAEAFK